MFWCHFQMSRTTSEKWLFSFSTTHFKTVYTARGLNIWVPPNTKPVLENVWAHGPFSDPHVRAIMHIAPGMHYLVGPTNVGDKLNLVTQRILDKGLCRIIVREMEILGYGLIRPIYYINQHCRPGSWLVIGGGLNRNNPC
jgi:hypothetical protein